MTVLELDNTPTSGPIDRPTVALCGSFRKDPDGLGRALSALRDRFEVLSPVSLDFVDPSAEFVRLAWEVGESELTVERRHLEAMSSADLIWLHAPDGYVGTSAAMELGHAAALGIPVFATTAPADPVLSGNVHVVSHPDQISLEAVERAGSPGHGVDRLQRYYRAAAERRGWSEESSRDTLLLLIEELGELARAIRKSEGLSRHHADGSVDVGGELADVQLYVVHLANSLGLNLAEAVTGKERVNAARAGSRDVA